MPRKPKPVPEVVELARQLLERAESGDIRAIGIVSVHAGRATGTAYHLGDALAELNLATDWLKQRLLAEHG